MIWLVAHGSQLLEESCSRPLRLNALRTAGVTDCADRLRSRRPVQPASCCSHSRSSAVSVSRRVNPASAAAGLVVSAVSSAASRASAREARSDPDEAGGSVVIEAMTVSRSRADVVRSRSRVFADQRQRGTSCRGVDDAGRLRHRNPKAPGLGRPAQQCHQQGVRLVRGRGPPPGCTVPYMSMSNAGCRLRSRRAGPSRGRGRPPGRRGSAPALRVSRPGTSRIRRRPARPGVRPCRRTSGTARGP